MWILVFFLIAIILALIIRLTLLENEINTLALQIEEVNHSDSRRKLRVALKYKGLSNLAYHINKLIEKEEEMSILSMRNDMKFKDDIMNLSHDLRTPLTSLLGYLSLVKVNPEKLDEYLIIIENKAELLNVLIENFYDMCVFENISDLRTDETHNLTEILSENLIGSYDLFSAMNIKVDIQIPDKPFYANGNKLYFDRIFQNIISNSIRHSSGDISVKMHIKDDESIILFSNTVKDINENQVSHLFERFYRADSSRRGKGAGLGLYIVKLLCEKLDGKISANLIENVENSNLKELQIILKFKSFESRTKN